MLNPGQIIKNQYRADEFLARGGMGEVWRCQDLSLDRPVAVKIVNRQLTRDHPQNTAIFVDEAKIGGSMVGHPNIVSVFELINEPTPGGNLLAIVMEYVEGMSCADWIRMGETSLIDSESRHYLSLMIAMETCKALNYAHRKSILHRDIKPLNIFISKYGVSKIGDFGIARYADAVTREHTVWSFRSPAYSAPEQWRNEKATSHTDIYQLGCTLYHLLAGRVPFVAMSSAALIEMHLTRIPDNPSLVNPLISADLSKVILRCLEKERDDRPALWEVIDAIAKDLHRNYRLTIVVDKSDVELIDKVVGITDFQEGRILSDGSYSWQYVDFSEALSEAFELLLLGRVGVKLDAMKKPSMAMTSRAMTSPMLPKPGAPK